MRIATGGYAHETNAFGNILVDKKPHLASLKRGKEEYFQAFSGVRTDNGGMIDEARELGIDWRNERILALKSSHHFRGWWQDKVPTIIPCDSPGVHSADLSSFDFKHLNKDCFPFRDVVR